MALGRVGLIQVLDPTSHDLINWGSPVVQTEHKDRYQPCSKCGSTTKKTGQFRASGGFLSSFFDFVTEKFNYESCSKCGFTEFYNNRIGTGTRILDFMGS
ncbi:MAG: hypothetical protein H0U76_14590 [Ktedonobacteraceae bacterium]|nr:hypothetical protein [Ktedonobacteraceae bacterium]